MKIPNSFTPPERHLMGPGPSDVAPAVLAALAKPLIGHLDPAFVTLMDELKAMLREVFATQNELTFPVSGTGSAGMEFCFVNLIEPGDEVIIGVNGVFGTRMCDVAARRASVFTRRSGNRITSAWRTIRKPGARNCRTSSRCLAASSTASALP